MTPTRRFNGWHKAQASSGTGNGCVEVGYAPGYRGVRDSKLGEASPVMAFDHRNWSAFLTAVKAGELDG
ncbi:DUF397 domain-containing protein [Saccharopolyspora sp. ASAGF58]|uniref:DUF397 domain-containing protein n=1 Tax=Saccharopolyspora sp. ASAGF58 TaxID=2719023 RepID=UPI0014403202|nr:DUF397 domain-containing protein [Saccharopolyspora sp. ASAGF58]QIZ36132.1 DUF397 domain-containing protein [Saccharopolyspora sp. ASAGF58]